jgi:hypothetical protein
VLEADFYHALNFLRPSLDADNIVGTGLAAQQRWPKGSAGH